MKKTNYKISLMFVLTLVVLLSILNVSAYARLCMGYGQVIPNQEDPRYTCWHDECQICITNNLFPSHPGNCNGISGCSPFDNGTGGIDSQAPALSINSPILSEVYNERGVLFDVVSDEPASLYWKDNNDPKGIWKRLASNTRIYSNEISMKEGLNDISIKGEDRNQNEAIINVTFSVDSKAPKIKSIEPTAGFVSSLFTVEYDEDNVEQIKLNYGNLGTGFKESALASCPSGVGVQCTKEIELTEYDGQEIEYWFSVEDIAGNIVNSKHVEVNVDETDPVLTDLTRDIDGKNVVFSMNVDEVFFNSVTYVDTLDPKGKPKVLCSSLDNGMCVKKVSFKDGNHEVVITASDLAGNNASQTLTFFTDSKKPKIKKTEPKSEFANGEFAVEFDEVNPKTLNLYYGLSGSELIQNVNLATCVVGKSTKCEISVNLASLDGQEIGYWFELTDKVDNVVVSKTVELEVDVTDPVINDLDFTVSGKSVLFDILITESNFDSVTYLDNNATTPKWVPLCSKLTSNKCTAKKTFSNGPHNVDIMVLDESGNAVSQSVNFNII